MIVNHQWSIQSRSSASTACRLWFLPQESRALLGRPYISIMGTARRRAIWRRQKVVQDLDNPSDGEIDRWLFLSVCGFTGFVSFVMLCTSSELYGVPPAGYNSMYWVSSRFETNSVTPMGHMSHMIWTHCGWSYSVPAPTGVLQLLIVVAYLIEAVYGSSAKRRSEHWWTLYIVHHPGSFSKNT